MQEIVIHQQESVHVSQVDMILIVQVSITSKLGQYRNNVIHSQIWFQQNLIVLVMEIAQIKEHAMNQVEPVFVMKGLRELCVKVKKN